MGAAVWGLWEETHKWFHLLPARLAKDALGF